ncbi:acetylxylan esterase [Flavilitoribacter nigricans]|nr:acetylxylan esterase [Flavilitoribacter nigricans]
MPDSADPGTKLWAGPEKAMYYQGQEIKFKVTSNETGTVEYTIRESKRSPVLETGSFQLKAGETHYIRTKLNAPGFLELSVTQNWKTHRSGVAVDPCEIRAYGDEPSDFDSFWDAAMQRARSIAHNVSLTYRGDKSDASQRSYKFRIDNIDQKFISGWISIPTCSGPYPAIVRLPSYGREPVGPASHFASEGAIAIALSVHSYDAEKKVPKEVAYQPEDHYMDRNRNYFKAAVLGTIRAIDYLETMPEYDGRNLAVTGVSQGGGLAIMVAGLDPRVQLLVQSQAAFCDHAGAMEDHPSGFPYWVKNGRDTGKDINKVLRETAYYDAVFFARRFQGKSLHVVGYKDDVCPPSTVFAAINAIPGDKKMLHGTATGHESHPDFWPVRREFFAENLPVSPYPECPDQSTLTDTSNDPGVLPSSLRTYPNPISSTNRIELELNESREVDISLWNSQGIALANLYSGKVPAGVTHLDWDAGELPPGVYLIRMSTPDTEIVKRVLKMNNH